MLEDKPVVFVESKAFDVSLSDVHSQQIISYGRVEDIQWVVLTNGSVLKFFNTKEGKTERECLVVEVDLKNLLQQAEDLNLISRESIFTGEIEETAKRMAAVRRAIRSFKQRQKELEEEFKNVLIKLTGAEVKNRVEAVSAQLAKQTIQLFEKQVEAGPSYPQKGEIPLISRNELTAKAFGEIIVCPSRIEGVEFLKKYNAWGFVNLSEAHKPKFFALYVGRPESAVLYFGEIESITKPLESKEELRNFQEKDIEEFKTGKRAIHLKQGTLVKFKDPIPLKNRRTVPRGPRYTTLKKLIQANHIDEL